MSDQTLDRLIRAAEQADWMQVVLNQGPPCFHFEADEGRFCLRAQRWQGHVDGGKYPEHTFVPLAALLREASSVSAAGAPTHTTRFAWLMERRLKTVSDDMRRVPAGTLVYWDGGHAQSFTTDPNRAVQWCRREDALNCTQFTKNYAQWDWQIVEHVFMEPTASSSPSSSGTEGASLQALIKQWRRAADIAYDIAGTDDARLSERTEADVLRQGADKLASCAYELEDALLRASLVPEGAAPPANRVQAVMEATQPFAAYLKCCRPLKASEEIRLIAGQFARDCLALIAAVDQLHEIIEIAPGASDPPGPAPAPQEPTTND